MEFKRISEDTVRCIVSMEDMDELSIRVDELFANADKQRTFLETIVERAREEVNYNPPGDMIPIQVMPLEDQGLVVMLMERENAGAAVKDILGQTLESVKELTEKSDEMSAVEVSEKIKNLLKPDPQEKKKQGGKDKKEAVSKIQIFSFAALEYAEQYCVCLNPQRNIKSKLMKDRKGVFYLILEKGRLSAAYFKDICLLAQEFGTLNAVTKGALSNLEEHTECLIKKNAVNKLAMYV